MSDPGAHLLTKVTAVGVVGVLGSMAVLLCTLRVASPVSADGGGEVLSQLAFEAQLERGSVIECSYGERGLCGVRHGVGAERIAFRVAGEIPSRLLERIVLRKVPLRSEASQRPSGGPPQGVDTR